MVQLKKKLKLKFGGSSLIFPNFDCNFSRFIGISGAPI
jgi:hypothetical protein